METGVYLFMFVSTAVLMFTTGYIVGRKLSYKQMTRLIELVEHLKRNRHHARK